MKFKLILATIALAFCSTAYSQTEPACVPESPNAIRSGVIGKDVWFYWWCKNETSVWLNWNGFLNIDLTNFLYVGASAKIATTDPFNMLVVWGDSSDVLSKQNLKAAVMEAAAGDVLKPLPGTPTTNAQIGLPELWNVTQNGASTSRKTNLLVNGVVGGYSTTTVRVGKPCDCSVSYPIGSTTKWCKIYSGNDNEVVSCSRLQ